MVKMAKQGKKKQRKKEIQQEKQDQEDFSEIESLASDSNHSQQSIDDQLSDHDDIEKEINVQLLNFSLSTIFSKKHNTKLLRLSDMFKPTEKQWDQQKLQWEKSRIQRTGLDYEKYQQSVVEYKNELSEFLEKKKQETKVVNQKNQLDLLLDPEFVVTKKKYIKQHVVQKPVKKEEKDLKAFYGIITDQWEKNINKQFPYKKRKLNSENMHLIFEGKDFEKIALKSNVIGTDFLVCNHNEQENSQIKNENWDKKYYYEVSRQFQNKQGIGLIDSFSNRKRINIEFDKNPKVYYKVKPTMKPNANYGKY